MHRRFSAWAILAAVGLLISCADPETHPDAVRNADGTQRYADGLYAVAFSHPDPEGWRPFLTVEVQAGLLTTVCFDAVNGSGVRLRDAEDLLERTRLDHGVHLDSLVTTYQESVLETQARPGPVDPQLSKWAIYFDLLLREAFASAEGGPQTGVRAAAQQSPVLIPMQGPYYVSDSPDALGWQAELVTIHDAAGVLAAHYAEVRRDAGEAVRKRTDPLYADPYEQARGVRFSTVADELAAQSVGAALSAVDAGVYAVSGATLTARRFALLTARIADFRSPVPLPRRLCP